MNMMDLATMLFGRSRAEENTVLTDATTRTYVGTAVTDSADGSVYVSLSEDVTLPDEDDGEHGTGVEMPTTVGVSEGDEVLVTVFGGGTMKAPVVTGNPGWGDDVDTRVTDAHDLAASVEGIAQEAKEVAEATGQNFWPDTDGVHVTEVTQDEWNDSEGASYHSGANVLLNALGQLFRDGLNNLLALVGGTNPGVAIYDGTGNDAENIVASFDGDGMTVFNNGLKLMKVGNLGNVYGIASYINDVLTGYIHSISGSINVHGIDATSVTGGSGFQSGLGEVYASAGSVRETLWLNGDSERSPSFERSVTSTGFTERSKTSSNTWSTPSGTVLWSGVLYMTGGHTVNLSHNISTCHSGIVLHFQPYTGSTVRNYFHNYCFVPKTHVASHNGAGITISLSSTSFANVGSKYLIVHDSQITGNDANDDTGTATSGIKFANNYWVLTQVIAV